MGDDIIPCKLYTNNLEQDMVIAYSSIEGNNFNTPFFLLCVYSLIFFFLGNKSFRHIFNGTWFIQELCRNFLTHGQKEDVISLLIRTAKCVTRRYDIGHKNYDKDSTAVVIVKQMPVFLSTLKKKFYLTKSKERNLFLELVSKNKELEAAVKELQKRVDDLFTKIN